MKKLNEYKKQSKQNMDRVINTEETPSDIAALIFVKIENSFLPGTSLQGICLTLVSHFGFSPTITTSLTPERFFSIERRQNLSSLSCHLLPVPRGITTSIIMSIFR